MINSSTKRDDLTGGGVGGGGSLSLVLVQELRHKSKALIVLLYDQEQVAPANANG